MSSRQARTIISFLSTRQNIDTHPVPSSPTAAHASVLISNDNLVKVGKMDYRTSRPVYSITNPDLNAFNILKDNAHLSVNIMSGYNHTPADDLAIATIRTLAVDTVGKANSGHPGLDTYFSIRRDCL